MNNVVYRRNDNLKELLIPSLFLIPKREKYNCVTGCNTCDLCRNCMVLSSTFVFNGNQSYIRGNFTFNSTFRNVLKFQPSESI